jgi:mannose-6-phosphate isomerase
MTTDSALVQRLYLLEPQYRERVWGGQRLKPNDPPFGEAWVAFSESRVGAGTHAGQTVAELAKRYGAQFLGAQVAALHGERFPLLIKLLDCADWLSVQVHPNDEQAARLVGPGETGKTEAWHFLEAEEGAKIYAGVKPGMTQETLAEAIRAGRVLDVARQLEVRAGETILIPAGTLHTIGPGLLLYEVQQSSDTTYRVYDWGRPAKAGRKLHIEESVVVIDPRSSTALQPPPPLQGTAKRTVVSSPFFELDLMQVGAAIFEGDTEGRAFQLLTMTEGTVALSCKGETLMLSGYDTALVAGGAGAYELRGVEGTAKVLRATLPAPA